MMQIKLTNHPVFHFSKSSSDMRLEDAMCSQVSPRLARVNILQLLTMPGCVGVGVARPPAVVVVGGGVPPMRPTHAY